MNNDKWLQDLMAELILDPSDEALLEELEVYFEENEFDKEIGS